MVHILGDPRYYPKWSVTATPSENPSIITRNTTGFQTGDFVEIKGKLFTVEKVRVNSLDIQIKETVKKKKSKSKPAFGSDTPWLKKKKGRS